MRRYFSFHVEDSTDFKQKIVLYCRKFEYGAVYDSCDYYRNRESEVDYHTADLMVGLDHIDKVIGGFEAVQKFQSEINDWMCGYWGYDLKDDLEKLYSVNHDGLNFDKAVFFQPRYVIRCIGNKWTIGYLADINKEEEAREIISSIFSQNNGERIVDKVQFTARVSKNKYCQSIKSILEHIHKGDIYELNYCMEFFAENTEINPFAIYNTLVEISPTPFSGLLKTKHHYVLCASPERYIKMEKNKIISQPIKGTAKRGADSIEDDNLKKDLASCIKERSENIMIVDLVRNDLSRVAEKGSVKVEELCGIYPFRQVFQMISTVTAKLDKDKTGMDAIRSSFPAGSMTGAPKVRAMKLIEKYEETKRGVYSGAIGYFTPEGDFDFNVVIRSLLYNSTNKYLSFMVGGAITEKSIPEKEYEECLLKAKAILQLFNQDKIIPYE
ncbi:MULTISPECIES: anthranilate synthase component I family protein [unclassified Saccharicrinis]|uniref:anthranilate synthase component I family protein n=1 Tax=unclassified Saccharicrinis TaxID=2646859 RepID=UPI003D34CDD4